MAKLSGNGKGKWHSERAFAKYKRKRRGKNKAAAHSRKANRS